MHSFLKQYKNSGFPLIEGWCEEKVFEVINFFNELPINKNGGCLEIGVHHGKFFILLNSIIEPKFKSYAIDVFENQSLNIDNSGSGSLEKFKMNLMQFDRHKGKNVKVICGDSLDRSILNNQVITPGSLRFISIDGGHTSHHTISDLKFAEEVINNEGIVILDDLLNPHWLGVIEGLLGYLNSKPTLAPFAIGHNKLYLAKFSFQEYYFKKTTTHNFFTKEVKFAGFKVAAL